MNGYQLHHHAKFCSRNKYYNEMKTYSLMAIELYNYIDSMNLLGLHYQFDEPNYELMKKYHLMAIEHKNIDTYDSAHIISYYYLLKYYIQQNNVKEINHLLYEIKPCMIVSYDDVPYDKLCYVSYNEMWLNKVNKLISKYVTQSYMLDIN